jgi:signal transduction histidine kinase
MTKPDPVSEPNQPRSSRSPRWLKSLRARLAAVILIALLPTFILLVAVAAVERARAADAAIAEQISLARLIGDQYLDMIESTQQLLAWAALFPELREGDAEACNARLVQLFGSLSGYRGISVSEVDGSTECAVAYDSAPPSSNLAERPLFRKVLETGNFALGDMDFAAGSRRPDILFGMPILGDDGEIMRVLGTGIDVDTLNLRLLGADFPEDVIVTLTDADGQVILRSTQADVYLGEMLPIAAEIAAGAPEGTGYALGLDGIQRQYAWTTIIHDSEPAFRVLVGYTDQRIFGGVNRTLRASLIGLSLIMLVALAAAWLGAETMIVQRIERLVRTANRMRDGDLQTRTGMVDDTSEFGQLAAALDALADALHARMHDNERLIAEMTELNAGLEQRVAERTLELETTNVRLTDSQAELRRLSKQLMSATEAERTRIARDIHDQLGQIITATKMEVTTLRRRLLVTNIAERFANDASAEVTAIPADWLAKRAEEHMARSAQIEAKIGDINTLLDETVVLVRRIAADLRPGLLDDFGLVAAIEAHLADFEWHSSIAWTFEADIDEEALSDETALILFRILQEALTNVARHAQADHVQVELKSADGVLYMCIRDNGRGISPEEQLSHKSLGLLGLHERAGQLGGVLSIVGAEGDGTSVVLRVPLDAEPGAEERTNDAGKGTAEGVGSETEWAMSDLVQRENIHG